MALPCFAPSLIYPQCGTCTFPRHCRSADGTQEAIDRGGGQSDARQRHVLAPLTAYRLSPFRIEGSQVLCPAGTCDRGARRDLPPRFPRSLAFAGESKLPKTRPGRKRQCGTCCPTPSSQLLYCSAYPSASRTHAEHPARGIGPLGHTGSNLLDRGGRRPPRSE